MGSKINGKLARRWFFTIAPVGWFVSRKPVWAAAPTSTADRIIDALSFPDSLAAIGKSAATVDLGRAAPTASDAAIANLLRRHPALEAAVDERGSLRRAIASAIRADFAAEDIVVVDGWVLARAEVEIAIAAYGRIWVA